MSLESYNLARKIGLILKKKKLTITTAESCTGGLLAATITAVDRL
jgi:nicotinamide mononucleotide (NMN) deamidase PncC